MSPEKHNVILQSHSVFWIESSKVCICTKEVSTIILKEMGTSHLTNTAAMGKYMGKAKHAVCSIPSYLKKSLAKDNIYT